MKSLTRSKTGHVESKTRSLGQILEKPCVCCRDQIFGLKNVFSLVLRICLNLEGSESNTTKPYGLANQKLCYIKITDYGDEDKECI